MAKTITLEESFQNLEQIISSLENGKMSLDESFKAYNEGMKLVKNCNSQLDKVEKQIIVIEEDNNGGTQ